MEVKRLIYGTPQWHARYSGQITGAVKIAVQNGQRIEMITIAGGPISQAECDN